MSMAVGSKLHFQPGSWLEAGYEVFIGAVTGGFHSVYLVSRWWYANLVRPVLSACGLRLSKDKVVQSKDGQKTLKVVAAGFGRTGTVRSTKREEENDDDRTGSIALSYRVRDDEWVSCGFSHCICVWLMYVSFFCLVYDQ